MANEGLTRDGVARHYLDDAIGEFRKLKRFADKAVAQVSDEDWFRQLDPESNAIAIVMKHIVGNMRSRWTDFLTTDGEKPDRDRDSEFELGGADTKDRLLERWENGWRLLFDALSPLTADDLQKTVTIRGEPHTVLQAINRQVAHYAHHVGQILFLAKHLRSSEWKSLSIPRGKSEEYKTDAPKSDRGVPREK
jgi:hypothetical protein